MATSDPGESLELLLRQLLQAKQDGNAALLANNELFWDHQNMILDREDKINKQTQDNWLKQFEFGQAQAADQKAYQEAMLMRQDKQIKGEVDYRNKLLMRQDRQAAWDREERARVREQSQLQFDKQFAAQQEYNAENLAFQRERADKTDAARVRAEVQAEAGTRRQVLAGLGFHNQQARTSSPLEALFMQVGKRKQPRLRRSY